MNAYPESSLPIPVEGHLLLLGERHAVAIYKRDNVHWVAEFIDGCAEITDATTWFRFHAGALQHSRRRRAAALQSATALPEEVLKNIECLHRQAEARDARIVSAGVAVLDSVQRYCSDMASRIRGLASKRTQELS